MVLVTNGTVTSQIVYYAHLYEDSYLSPLEDVPATFEVVPWDPKLTFRKKIRRQQQGTENDQRSRVLAALAVAMERPLISQMPRDGKSGVVDGVCVSWRSRVAAKRKVEILLKRQERRKRLLREVSNG